MLHLSAWNAHVLQKSSTSQRGMCFGPHFRNWLGHANYKKWLLIDDYLSEIFATVVPDGEEHKYKPTIALANLLFSAPNLDAVMYPSVATADHGINVCTLPDKAHQLFSPLEGMDDQGGGKRPTSQDRGTTSKNPLSQSVT